MYWYVSCVLLVFVGIACIRLYSFWGVLTCVGMYSMYCKYSMYWLYWSVMPVVVGIACIRLDSYWCVSVCIGMYGMYCKYCMYWLYSSVLYVWIWIVCSVCIQFKQYDWVCIGYELFVSNTYQYKQYMPIRSWNITSGLHLSNCVKISIGTYWYVCICIWGSIREKYVCISTSTDQYKRVLNTDGGKPR